MQCPPSPGPGVNFMKPNGLVAAASMTSQTLTPSFSQSVVIFTALGMTYHVILSNAVFGNPMTVPWYFMTALPFLFVLLVRGLETIDRRLATVAAALLAVLFVVIDLHGTWVQMPRHYANTTDAALQWSRLTSIHPAILSGDLRWLFLATQLGVLCLVVGGLVHAWRIGRGPEGSPPFSPR